MSAKLKLEIAFRCLETLFSSLKFLYHMPKIIGRIIPEVIEVIGNVLKECIQVRMK